jgi:hypothetical protein
MTTYTRPEVSFTATAAISGGKLVVDYALTNRTEKTIYVFDRTTRFDAGAVTVEPDRMFVLLGNGDVRVLHAYIGLPELRDVRRRPPVLASEVAPRAEHRRKVALELPLVENQQFYSSDPMPDPPVTVDRARVQVGWVESRPGMSVTTLTVGSRKEVQLAGGWGMPTQWISEATVSVPGVTVRRHVEPFERMPKLD